MTWQAPSRMDLAIEGRYGRAGTTHNHNVKKEEGSFLMNDFQVKYGLLVSSNHA